jgi:DNA-binding transcriptional ArsR family regulator
MNAEPDIARLASLIVEPARAAILLHLLDGRSWTATELAKVAGVRTPAASAHLKKLLAGGMIKVSPTGRHRYYRLASAEIASFLEQFARSAPVGAALTPGERRASNALRECRLCYDHLAGRLGVGITVSMRQRGWLIEEEPWYRLTDAGRENLLSLGIEPAAGRTCMDWSQRQLHLAGTLGRTVANFLLTQKMLQRDSKSRALRVTPIGTDAIRTMFGVKWSSVPGRPPSIALPETADKRYL